MKSIAVKMGVACINEQFFFLVKVVTILTQQACNKDGTGHRKTCITFVTCALPPVAAYVAILSCINQWMLVGGIICYHGPVYSIQV